MANEQAQVNVDVAGYPANKTAGSVKIILLDGAHLFCVKKFDPVTGKPIPDRVPISREAIQAFKDATEKNLAATLAGCDAILADIDAAKEV